MTDVCTSLDAGLMRLWVAVTASCRACWCPAKSKTNAWLLRTRVGLM